MQRAYFRVQALETRRLLASGLLKDIIAGTDGSSPYGFTTVGSQVYFFATQPSGQIGLFKTSGTAATTTQVISLPAQTGAGIVRDGTSGKFYFVATDANNHDQLYRSDGTAAGTVAVTDHGDIQFDISWTSYQYAAIKAISATKEVFTAPSSGTHNLYSTDGTDVTLVHTLYDQFTVAPNDFTLAGTQMFFQTGNTGAPGFPIDKELWKTDGTTGGTQEVFAFNAGDVLSDFHAAGSLVYFIDRTFSAGWSMWRSDGTAAGTFAITEGKGFSGNDAPGSAPTGFLATNVGNTLYFTALHDTLGYALWKSDGTVAGTQLVNPSATGNDAISSLESWQGSVLYIQTNSSGTGIWKYASSSLIATQVVSVDPSATGLHAAGTVFYYSVLGPSSMDAIWRSDGTAGGTKLIASDIPSNFGMAGPLTNSAPLGSALVYAGYSANEGLEPRLTAVPAVTSINYQFKETLPQIVIDFDDVITPASLPASSISLIRVDGSPIAIPGTQLSVTFNTDHTEAVVKYTGTTNNVLPDGNYVIGIAAGVFTNALGISNFDSASQNFFVFAGDANHDRKVDVDDLYTLATNWFGSGKTFGQGDFNYDGIVDGKDLGILGVHWQQTLAAPTPMALLAARATSILPVRAATRGTSRTAISLIN